MIHLIAALGILLTTVLLKPLYVALLLALDMAASGLLFHRLMLLGELWLIAGLLIAWIIAKYAGLGHRLPSPIPGRPWLIAGVWIFVLFLVMTLVVRLIPHAVYMLPTKYLLRWDLIIVPINAILLFGVGKALLAAHPISHAKS